MRSRVIGGEFELTGVPEVLSKDFGYYSYASGRTALYQILMSIKLETFKVWLPDWLCESMIDAVRRSGISYSFYTLGRNLEMDVDQFVQRNRPVSEHDVIVLVNYFGLINVERTIKQLKDYRVDSIIIEDDVQALFSFMDDEHHLADYRFTSLRKSIACPDGGLVFTKRIMPRVSAMNTFAPLKLKASLVKGGATEEGDDEEYLRPFEEGEARIEENYNSVMSSEAAQILSAIDLQKASDIRKNNAQYLVKELFNLGVEPLVPIDPAKTPLFVPIAVENRDELRRELRRNQIFCPVHWPLRDDMRGLPMGQYMAEHELSLVVDQRYGLEDMQAIVEIMKNYICK